jgi:hypothetical protein
VCQSDAVISSVSGSDSVVTLRGGAALSEESSDGGSVLQPNATGIDLFDAARKILLRQALVGCACTAEDDGRTVKLLRSILVRGLVVLVVG